MTFQKPAQSSLSVLSELLDLTAEGVLITSPAGIITDVNDSACQQLGYCREALIGQSIAQLLPPQEQAHLEAALAAAAPQREIWTIQHKDDRLLRVEARTRTLADGRWAAFLRPLADPALSAAPAPNNPDQSIRQQLIELEAIYRAAPIGLCFIDTGLKFVRINEQLAQINGFSVAEHIGRTLREILPEQADFLEPLYRQVIESGEPIQNLQVHGTNRAQPGIERDWLVSYYPQKDAADRVVGVNVMVQEITDRRRAEADLQERTEHLRLLYETTRDLLSTDQPLALVEALFAKLKPLIALDIYFNYLLDEPQQMLHLAFYGGISQAQAKEIEWLQVGRAICGTVAEQRCQIVQPHLQQSTDPKTELVRSLGLTAYSCQPLLAQGKLFGTLGFGSRSRTEFTAAETNLFQALCDQIAIAMERSELLVSLQHQTAELQRVNRLKDDFFSALSHELRTPLNPILGWTKLLQSQRLTPDKAKQAIDTIERNTRQQISLVDDLLDVARAIRGGIQLDLHPVDLALTLTTAIETVQFAAQAKNIAIDYTPATAIYTQGEGDRLQQIFWNLLSNAIKFTPAGGRVEVKLESFEFSILSSQFSDPSQESDRFAILSSQFSDPTQNSKLKTQNSKLNPPPSSPAAPYPPPLFAQITITDTGIGIAPDLLPRVFDYFWQAESGTTRSYSGLGLGLTIVRYLVELHGGTIAASSKGLGQGATFTVTLPLLQREEVEASGSGEAGEPGSKGAGEQASGQAGEQGGKGAGEQASRQAENLAKSETAQPTNTIHPLIPSSPHPLIFPSPERPTPHAPLAGIRVLLLDDEPDNLALLRFVLEQEGMVVTAETSPRVALDYIARSLPDLLVSDIGMPEMDGYEFIRQVRRIESQQQIPAIALTAFAQPEDQQRALESGYQAFIPKPIDPFQVIETLTRFAS